MSLGTALRLAGALLLVFFLWATIDRFRLAGALADARAAAAECSRLLGDRAVELGAATERAEARGALLSERKAADDRTIEAAPRDGDGRVVCDAACLSELAR